jgi:predicted RNA methylase
MKIPEEVKTVLRQADIQGERLFLRMQLDRKLYVATNKVLEAMGGQWKRKEKCHVFNRGDLEEIRAQILEDGEIETPQEYGFFETPGPVVERLMQLAKIERGMTALEPSAGKGAIASQLVKRGAAVTCVEYLDENVQALRESGLYFVWQGDFLACGATPAYDRVVMNPPFARQADIVHVNHAKAWLKPGGRLVSVMSAGVLFRDNRLTREFRDFVDNHGEFEELPEDSFKVAGTRVRTCIVSLEV